MRRSLRLWQFNQMAAFGLDFHRAKQAWLFPREKTQGFWRALGLTLLLFVLYNVLQAIFGALIFRYGFGESLDGIIHPNGDSTELILRSALLSILPSFIPIFLLALWFGKFGLPERQGLLQLRLPNLGWVGWGVVLVGFVGLTLAVYQLFFVVMGLNPKDYEGLVEKTMASIAIEPKMFPFVALSAVVAAPVVEEFIFRGALFAALVASPVGRIGALLITSALFAAVHATGAYWPNLIMIFFIGLFLGFLMLRFSSIWLTIICHGTWNALQTGLLFFVGTQS